MNTYTKKRKRGNIVEVYNSSTGVWELFNEIYHANILLNAISDYDSGGSYSSSGSGSGDCGCDCGCD